MMETGHLQNGNSTISEQAKTKRARRKVSKKKQQKEVKANFLTITRQEHKEEEDHNVLVSFYTKQQQFAVPRSAISVPDDTNPVGLNQIVSTLIQQSTFTGTVPVFDFLVDGALLSGKLIHYLNSSESVSREGGLSIEYLEQLPPPTPRDALKHDDWVSSLHYGANHYLVTGCYDKTVHIWHPRTALSKSKEHKLSDDVNAHKLAIPDAHKAPVKAVSWIPKSNNRFISCGMDQSVLVWEWCPTSNTVHCVYDCRGHTQSLESVAVSADGKLFATGAWDGALKIWTTDEEGVTEKTENVKEPNMKRSKVTLEGPKCKTPRFTLSDHSQSVSGLVWPTLGTLASCSWDNSVRLWDIEEQKKLKQYVAPCNCMALDASPFNNTILVTTMDTHVRLLDPREDECLSLTKVYQHHKNWVNSVKWSPSNENHFATGGFDNVVKLWDIRGARAPLFEMLSHEGKVFAIDWSSPGLLFSASADTNVKMFTI
uniref:Ribosome biogenesis protein WDR12 homolog n=1 Tax=Hirondellea gigas TaxID=1518452 RepID=A0A6A7FQ55_9CRUS